MTQNNQNKPNTLSIETTSQRFVAEVERQFVAEMGTKLSFTDYERTLAQHLFLKIDFELKALEIKRLNGPNPDKYAPKTWENVNMRKLALDAVHRVKLGLDALIPNHISVIPYWNSKEGKYDVDLRIGYKGKDYYRREMAIEKPLDIRYELVYSTDHFRPIKKSKDNDIETYEFEITKPFERGEIIGGFGYIIYDDPRKNVLVLVPESEFKKAMSMAQAEDFWKKFPMEMRYKTLVTRTTDRLQPDPKNINAKSYGIVEAQEIEQDERPPLPGANSVPIDIKPVSVEVEEPEKQEPEKPKQEPKIKTEQPKEIVRPAGPSFSR